MNLKWLKFHLCLSLSVINWMAIWWLIVTELPFVRFRESWSNGWMTIPWLFVTELPFSGNWNHNSPYNGLEANQGMTRDGQLWVQFPLEATLFFAETFKTPLCQFCTKMSDICQICVVYKNVIWLLYCAPCLKISKFSLFFSYHPILTDNKFWLLNWYQS